jgi:hypothetical protein
MDAEALTIALARRVMSWGIAPDRFLLGGGSWLPRWRFQPTQNLMDAFQLLDGAAPDEYSMSGGNGAAFQVRVRIGNVIGEARGASKALAITHAVARAVGIAVEP